MNDEAAQAHATSPPTILIDPQYFLAPAQSSTSSKVAGNDGLPDYILQYTRIFWTQVLVEVFRHILCLELSPNTVQLYYIATMRANELVCSVGTGLSSSSKPSQPKKSDVDVLFINVLAFQQSGCCDTIDDVPIAIPQDKLSDVLSYWTTRVAMAFRDAKPSSKGGKFSNHNVQPIPTSNRSLNSKATGLYDAEVRKRFQNRVAYLLSQ